MQIGNASLNMPKACPYAMALSFDISSYPGMILYPCLGVLGGIVVAFWVVWGFLGAFWGGFGDFVGEKFCHIGKSYYFCNRK